METENKKNEPGKQDSKGSTTEWVQAQETQNKEKGWLDSGYSAEYSTTIWVSSTHAQETGEKEEGMLPALLSSLVASTKL